MESHGPLPPPPRILLNSFWRGLRPDDWGFLPLTLLPVLVTFYIARLLYNHATIAGDQTGLTLLGAIAFDLLWIVGVAFFWMKIIRRIGNVRRLCREAPAIQGFVLSKRIRAGGSRNHYQVTYLFTNPHTGQQAKLEGQVPRLLWEKLAPGDHLNVLVDQRPGKMVVVYEFCGFQVAELNSVVRQ